MQLTISPRIGLPDEPETAISVSGDVLTLNGTSYDLSAVPEGGEAIPQGEGHPFDGAITRVAGAIHATIRAAWGETAERNQPTDPAHWVLVAGDGPVTLPLIRKPEERPA